jgi:hypothetical protein
MQIEHRQSDKLSHLVYLSRPIMLCVGGGLWRWRGQNGKRVSYVLPFRATADR